MKKRMQYLSVVLCFIFMSGCSGLKIERNVSNNVFYSSANPSVRIKISPEFRYVGTAEERKHNAYSDGTVGGVTVDCTSYIFVQKDRYNYLKKAISIRFYSTQGSGYWQSDIFSWLKNMIDSGIMNIHGENYQFSVIADPHPFTITELTTINSNGCIVPNCLLAKGFGRRVSTDNKTKMIILYAEDAQFKGSNNYGYRQWLNVEAFTDEQREFLREFMVRSEGNIKIVD